MDFEFRDKVAGFGSASTGNMKEHQKNLKAPKLLDFETLDS